MDFRKNPQYEESKDNLAQIEISNPIIIEHYYKFSIINSPSVFNDSISISKFITEYYNNKKIILNTVNTKFKENINLLDFLYDDVDNITIIFNNFF